MNKFVEWSAALSVGIDEIDAQHQALIDLINEMQDAVVEGVERERQLEVLGRLAEYTKIHFAVEESLMRIFGYPDYERHKGQHEGLIRNMLDLQHRLALDQTPVDDSLMRHLRHWLLDHILQSDQDYSRFFLASGALSRHQKASWATRMWDHLHFCGSKCWS
ncbi:putative Bacteriohemerythrin [Thiocapsa sp. KS1]|jgi:hemerythrin|nr:bacteriohemerythrin [Thiocapsa sp. KS1]CRI65153.1 putative Bacteriohemerythrin [Thiocapsa sp. KS1]